MRGMMKHVCKYVLRRCRYYRLSEHVIMSSKYVYIYCISHLDKPVEFTNLDFLQIRRILISCGVVMCGHLHIHKHNCMYMFSCGNTEVMDVMPLSNFHANTNFHHWQFSYKRTTKTLDQRTNIWLQHLYI